MSSDINAMGVCGYLTACACMRTCTCVSVYISEPVDLQKWSSCPFFKLYRFKSAKPTLPAQVSLACPEGQELFGLAERGDHCTITEIPLDTDNDKDTRDGEENDAADGNSVAGPAQCTDSGHASESSSLSGEHQVAPNGPRTTFTLGDELDFMHSAV